MNRRDRTGAAAGAASTLALGLVGAALVVAAWEATRRLYALPPIVLPSPLAVLQALVSLSGTAAFWRDVGESVLEFTVGYLLGGGLGIAVGVAMGEVRTVRQLVGPTVEAFRFIVPFAWIPLTVLWFGTSFAGKAVLVGYAVFFVMAVSTARALTQVDPTLSRVGTILGMSRFTRALRVHLRAVAPTVASAAKAAAAVGWVAVVAAEYIGASRGLGVMITNASSSLATPVVIAGMIVIGLIGAAISALVGRLSAAALDYR